MGCGESKNAVATADTISQRKKPNEEDTIVVKEGEKESHNGQDLAAESSKPEEGGHGDEEKAAIKEGDGEIGGDGEEKKEPQGSPDQSLSSSDAIAGAVSDGSSSKSEDASGSEISKVEGESAEKKQVPEESETKNRNGMQTDIDWVMENVKSEAESNEEEEASSDIQSKASSPDDEQKEKA